jgi:hypothetical protein
MGLRCNVVHAKDCDAAKLFEPADEYLAKRVPGSTVDMPGGLPGGVATAQL